MTIPTRTTPRAPEVRDELGRFVGQPTTPATQINQAKVDATVSHWLFLYSHGYENIAPSEVFASSNVNWNSKGGVQ